MANTPKKMKDPTEAALSAIQDALTVRDSEPEQDAISPPPSPPHAAEPISEPPWRTVRSAAPAQDNFFDDEVHRADEQGTLRRPANDDRESIGQILRTLQRRPARTSYVIATVFAAVWMFAGLVLGWVYLPQLQSARPDRPDAPILGVLFAAFCTDHLLLRAGHMAWRSQGCGSSRSPWPRVAMRLAEPRRSRRESIVTVGRRSGARSPPWATASSAARARRRAETLW